MKITAIIVALNEAPFIVPAVSAIYPFVDRIFVQTGYDRSWNNQRVEPDGTLDKLLALPDPDGKITVLIRRIPDEAIARNLLMRMDRYELNHRHRNTVGMDQSIGPFCEGADYFWVIDGDEIYDPTTIEPMLDHLRAKRPDVLRVRGLTYFRSWNYVVDPSDNFFQAGFMRAGMVFRENRNVDRSKYWRLIFNKYTRRQLSTELEVKVDRLVGFERLPEDVAVFHHGSYVGDDARIQKKIQLSVHSRETMSTWYSDVWLKWTPQSKNLHPFSPAVFPGVKHVPTAKLPPIIRDAPWPPGYLEHGVNGIENAEPRPFDPQ